MLMDSGEAGRIAAKTITVNSRKRREDETTDRHNVFNYSYIPSGGLNHSAMVLFRCDNVWGDLEFNNAVNSVK